MTIHGHISTEQTSQATWQCVAYNLPISFLLLFIYFKSKHLIRGILLGKCKMCFLDHKLAQKMMWSSQSLYLIGLVNLIPDPFLTIELLLWLHKIIPALIIFIVPQFLPVYNPSQQEKKDPNLYADNVQKLMAKYVRTS